MGSGGMLHAVVSSMHAHVLEGGGIVIGLARNAHHGRLGDWLREKRSFSRIWRHILRRPENGYKVLVALLQNTSTSSVIYNQSTNNIHIPASHTSKHHPSFLQQAV